MALQSGRSVQFTDLESVIHAYKTRGVPAFGLWQGSQFLFKYEGEDISEGAERLQAFCELLAESAAIYSLHVYEELTGKISNKTPYQGSFNFRFQADTLGYNQGAIAVRQFNERLLQLENKPEPAEEKTPSVLDQLGEVLLHPVIQSYLPHIGKILGINLPAVSGAAVAGVPANAVTISECIQVLEKNGMDVESILHTLAVMASTNPVKFQSVLAAIKTFQV